MQLAGGLNVRFVLLVVAVHAMAGAGRQAVERLLEDPVSVRFAVSMHVRIQWARVDQLRTKELLVPDRRLRMQLLLWPPRSSCQ